MKIIYPIIFKFGDIKRELLNEFEKITLYKTVKDTLKDDTISWANDCTPELENLFYTTPIYKHYAQESPDYIALRFSQWAEIEVKAIKDEKIIDPNTVFLIDLRGIDRDQQIYHISLILNRVLKGLEENEIRVIIILEKLPLENDALFKHLFNLVNKGKVCLIDKSTEVLVKSEKSFFNSENLKEKLKGKLIKKIGHFKSKTNENICKRYFFDGRYCDSEIRKLILEYIDESGIEKDKLEYIFYISKESPWLKESMSALSGTLVADMKGTFVNYKNTFNIEQLNSKITDCYNGGYILLVADFLNSTKTVKNSIITIKENFNRIENRKLHIISILNNITRGDASNNYRELNIKGEIYKIKYFVDVELEETSSSDCELCKFNIAINDIEEDNTLKLKSYDFWDLADKYGYENEQVKPNLPDRDAIFVPIFTRWVEENAAYLSYKFDRFVEANKINTKLNFAIIYPDESKANKDNNGVITKTASGFFAKKIKRDIWCYNNRNT